MAAAVRTGATTPSKPPAAPIAIAAERCKGCELCISVCPRHVLAIDVETVNALGHHPVRLTDAAGCTSCALCARICPDTAFTIYAPARVAAR